LVIFKSGFNTPQLAAEDLKRLKLSVAEGGNFAEIPVACGGDSEI
jgi:hypothetical protein